MTYIFNTTIAVPSNYPSTFDMKEVTTEEAAAILRGEYTSAIGHVGSADAIEAVTGIKPEVNRVQVFMESGDRALCLKLNGRLPEGVILDKKEVEKVGFRFILMTRTA